MKTTKPYRLKHVPTGLYLDVKSKQLKLNETGKIYTSGINSLNWDPGTDFIVAEVPDRWVRCKKSAFVKMGVEIKDVPYENT